jgi:hypothetical protein
VSSCFSLGGGGGGTRYFEVDLHFATCEANDILRPLYVLKCVQSNAIVPYNEDVNICKNHIM